MNRIEERINKFFNAVDVNDWETVKEIFAERLELDYSSMSGEPSTVMNSTNIINSWKGLLPGFTHTHHQIGNMVIAEKDDEATIFCYGTASHYLEHANGNLWTVVGSYDIDLKKIDGDWRITKHKFNFKFQDGNLSLPQAAMNKIK